MLHNNYHFWHPVDYTGMNVRLKYIDIEWRNKATYLGVKIDKKLTWGSHIVIRQT